MLSLLFRSWAWLLRSRDVNIMYSLIMEKHARDQEKKEACQRQNITLIHVPFWWDHKATSLAATIAQHRPDVLLFLPKSVVNANSSWAVPTHVNAALLCKDVVDVVAHNQHTMLYYTTNNVFYNTSRLILYYSLFPSLSDSILIFRLSACCKMSNTASLRLIKLRKTCD